jgi:hypothetical protein
MHGLETVTSVGKSAPDDDRHRIVEIRPAHLLFDIDRNETAFTGWGAAIEGELGVFIVGHRGFSPVREAAKNTENCWAGNLAGYTLILRFGKGFSQAGNLDLSF